MRVCLFAHLAYDTGHVGDEDPGYLTMQHYVLTPFALVHIGMHIEWPSLEHEEYGAAYFEVIDVTWDVEADELQVQVCQDEVDGSGHRRYGDEPDEREYPSRDHALTAWKHFGFEEYAQ